MVIGLAPIPALAAPPKQAGGGDKTPPELGRVHWRRGFDAAAAVAKTRKMPLLVLFDEVPGCGNCTGYGREVLSHPLIVEAIASNFIPVAVYNNIAGGDARTLKSFGEPAWNNPVVRIVAADRRELATRVSYETGVGGLADAMVAAIGKSGGTVPTYVRLVAAEAAAKRHGTERATFAMSCFWQGERVLGAIDGVVATLPGMLDGNEVVQVEFDPTVISFERLLKKAEQSECAARVFTRSDGQQRVAAALLGERAIRSEGAVRADGEPKYFLSQTALKFVPMTATQACRVNAAVAEKRLVRDYLSPQQNQMLETVQKEPGGGWPRAVGVDLVVAWDAFEAAEP